MGFKVLTKDIGANPSNVSLSVPDEFTLHGFGEAPQPKKTAPIDFASSGNVVSSGFNFISIPKKTNSQAAPSNQTNSEITSVATPINVADPNPNVFSNPQVVINPEVQKTGFNFALRERQERSPSDPCDPETSTNEKRQEQNKGQEQKKGDSNFNVAFTDQNETSEFMSFNGPQEGQTVNFNPPPMSLGLIQEGDTDFELSGGLKEVFPVVEEIQSSPLVAEELAYSLTLQNGEKPLKFLVADSIYDLLQPMITREGASLLGLEDDYTNLKTLYRSLPDIEGPVSIYRAYNDAVLEFQLKINQILQTTIEVTQDRNNQLILRTPVPILPPSLETINLINDIGRLQGKLGVGMSFPAGTRFEEVYHAIIRNGSALPNNLQYTPPDTLYDYNNAYMNLQSIILMQFQTIFMHHKVNLAMLATVARLGPDSQSSRRQPREPILVGVLSAALAAEFAIYLNVYYFIPNRQSSLPLYGLLTNGTDPVLETLVETVAGNPKDWTYNDIRDQIQLIIDELNPYNNIVDDSGTALTTYDPDVAHFMLLAQQVDELTRSVIFAINTEIASEATARGFPVNVLRRIQNAESPKESFEAFESYTEEEEVDSLFIDAGRVLSWILLGGLVIVGGTIGSFVLGTTGAVIGALLAVKIGMSVNPYLEETINGGVKKAAYWFDENIFNGGVRDWYEQTVALYGDAKGYLSNAMAYAAGGLMVLFIIDRVIKHSLN